ncbi:hypothetical protein D3C74_129840 [compost metagenome]
MRTAWSLTLARRRALRLRWRRLRPWNDWSVILRDNGVWIRTAWSPIRNPRAVALRSTARIDRQPLRINHCLALPRNGWQVVTRIVPTSVDDDLEVHMATGRVAGSASQGDQLTLLNALPHFGNQLRIVAVASLDIAAVINSHAHAGVPGPCRYGHRSSFRSVDRRAAGNRVVLANVDLVARTGRVGTPAIRAGNTAGLDRVHQLQVARQFAELADHARKQS